MGLLKVYLLKSITMAGALCAVACWYGLIKGGPAEAIKKIEAIWGDFAVAYKVMLSLIVLGVSFWLREWFDFLLILTVTGIMVIAEIFNTVIESICDYIQPERDPKIGEIKDVAASAVGISIMMWVFTLLYKIWRIWAIFFPG